MSTSDTTISTPAPRHVAIIMDGNGRWAQARGMERSAGHIEGVNAVRRITRAAYQRGIKYLTLYTFSTENWNRPQTEVDMLMHLIVVALERETPELEANNVSLRVIGDTSRMPQEARLRLESCIQRTAHCDGLILTLALSYSARLDLRQAMQAIARKVAAGTISPDNIDNTTIAQHLYTHDMPDPDLMIRTGGEHRISNFLLWEIAYSELYFSPVYWPDFDEQHLDDAIRHFNARERRYGKTSAQVRDNNNDNTPHI